MSTVQPAVSRYVQALVEGNYLLTREAAAVNRLPEALQEKAVELSEAERGPLMEKIVSELLNPPAAQGKRQYTVSQQVLTALFLFGLIIFLLNGLIGTARFLWGLARFLLEAGLPLLGKLLAWLGTI